MDKHSSAWSFTFMQIFIMPSTIADKLKIKAGDILLTLHAPAAFKEHLGTLPASVRIVSAGKNYQQVHWFVTSRAQVEQEAEKIIALIKESIICWIYFPKGSSGMQTDITRDKGWDALLAHSDKLTWLSLVSFDDTWSAFAFRLKTKADEKKKPAAAERPILQYIDAVTKTIRLPDDLAATLKTDKAAAAFFHSLSFTNRKEYVEWIVTAKQAATRKARIEGTLERLAKQWKNPRNL
jgi:hypothetical protein